MHETRSSVGILIEAFRGHRGVSTFHNGPMMPTPHELAAIALEALEQAGFVLVRSDSWRLRSDFDVVPQNDGDRDA